MLGYQGRLKDKRGRRRLGFSQGRLIRALEDGFAQSEACATNHNLCPSSPLRAGIMVLNSIEGGPAAKAGLVGTSRDEVR